VMLVLRPSQYLSNQKAMPIASMLQDILYSLNNMYQICKDNKGTILVCLACTHTERVQDSNGDIGNQRTLAAHAMRKHVHTEHSRETHVRAMAMAMERQSTPR
jgi:hypothetical protein